MGISGIYNFSTKNYYAYWRIFTRKNLLKFYRAKHIRDRDLHKINNLSKNMLIGEYIHTLDDKKRVSLPVKFRKEVGKKIIVTAGLDNCLWIFTLAQWKKISEKLSNFSMLQADNRSFNRYMFGSATEVEVDTIGRILLPEFLVSRASLKNKIAVVGVQDRIEIWNESAWREYKDVVEKKADQLAEKLGQAGAL
ncbi:MAG: division/cell wall cluster transcriptional repressor MraZ [bacterium]